MVKLQQDVIQGVATQVAWWVERRRSKLVELRHDTHAVNPFLWPIVMSMHGFTSFRELAAFQLAGHLVEGHATGFGKLIDEKVLEDVFGTVKLDAAYRRDHHEYQRPEYDNIDHIVPRDEEGDIDLLSLKAGRWSIQLGQAVQLNRSFKVLVDAREEGRVQFSDIVVGVFYGTEDTLTDKYRIIRGLPTRAIHDIYDISDHVQVLAGREFWAWLNDDEWATQEWVLQGIIAGYRLADETYGSMDELFEDFIDDYAKTYEKYHLGEGEFDWETMLKDING